MSILFDGNNDYASYAGSLGSAGAHPLTIALWLSRINLSGAKCVAQIGVGGGVDTESVSIRTNATGNVIARAHDASVISDAVTTVTALDTDWHHYAGVYSATNSRTAYLDGTASTTNTGNRTFSNSFDELIIGNSFLSNTDFNGYIAHVAIWTSALSGTDVASLAAGANPQAIDASNLFAYYPMTSSGSPGEDIVGSYDLTLYNQAAYDSNNPTVDSYGGGAISRLMLMGIG